MRIGNLAGRATLFVDDLVVDVERASDGRFGADPMACYRDRWGFFEWAAVASSGDSRPDRGAVQRDSTPGGRPDRHGHASRVRIGRDPKRWLTPADTLVSTIEGIGSMTTTFAVATS